MKPGDPTGTFSRVVHASIRGEIGFRFVHKPELLLHRPPSTIPDPAKGGRGQGKGLADALL
jgi:hypothetical protein